MPTLLEDIKTQSDWTIKAFAEDQLLLDYTIHSFIEIDKFFNRNLKNGMPLPNGRLAKNGGAIIFSIGSYVGETILKTVPGAGWQTDDTDEEGEINISIKFPDGTIVWPVQKVISRLQNGPTDSIYVYGYTITAPYTGSKFDETYWTVEHAEPAAPKPWWKFW